MTYDPETAAVLKAGLNAHNIMDGVTTAKIALRGIPVIYDENGSLERARRALYEAEEVAVRILARAATEARESGLGSIR